jgi:hypothetical protein
MQGDQSNPSSGFCKNVLKRQFISPKAEPLRLLIRTATL